MTDAEKIRFIAEKVMGWTVYTAAGWADALDTFSGDAEDIWLTSGLGLMPAASKKGSGYFNPLHNITQAIEAIERYRLSWGLDNLAWLRDEYSECVWWELTSPAEQAVEQAQWQALIYADDEYCAYADSPAAALCEALLQAMQENCND